MGFAALPKFFEIDGRFPEYGAEGPEQAVAYLAEQVKVDPVLFAKYQWSGRTCQITSWILRRPEDLDTDEALQLKQVLASCPHLDATATHVDTFAEILTGRHGDRLDSWMAAVDTDDLPHLHRFVTGLRRDYQAVRNGLTLSHSSGTGEGNVNRIKMIKRQMYGRAKFNLLRKRILLETHPARRMTNRANSITESGPDPQTGPTVTGLEVAPAGSW